MAEFQSIQSIGLKLAEDLVFLGYYSISELKFKDGAKLIDEYEHRKGFRVDPCVEDQFRLVIDYASTNGNTKNWWNFTDMRKQFRKENGYPIDRPNQGYSETLE